MKAKEAKKINKPAKKTAAGKAEKKPIKTDTGRPKAAAKQTVAKKTVEKRKEAATGTDKREGGLSFLGEEHPAEPSGTKLQIFLPEPDSFEEDLRDVFFAGFPEEYGENSVIAMPVDPDTLFVDWEIIPRDIAGEEGDLTLRLYDITGGEVAESDANAVIDISISQRIGSGFFDVHMAGREVFVAEGIMSPEGTFKAVGRSDIISFPATLDHDDLGIAQKLLEAGIPVGY
jgi:hypothetical protein